MQILHNFSTFFDPMASQIEPTVCSIPELSIEKSKHSTQFAIANYLSSKFTPWNVLAPGLAIDSFFAYFLTRSFHSFQLAFSTSTLLSLFIQFLLFQITYWHGLLQKHKSLESVGDGVDRFFIRRTRPSTLQPNYLFYSSCRKLVYQHSTSPTLLGLFLFYHLLFQKAC